MINELAVVEWKQAHSATQTRLHKTFLTIGFGSSGRIRLRSSNQKHPTRIQCGEWHKTKRQHGKQSKRN